ncbi:S-adenosyl-L-methionine-dependent methyltransferase, partial [Glonium stellatum]
MEHTMVVTVMGDRLHFAPLENPQNMIDLGTGTGIWAIEMGEQYPSATVLGIDLSLIQPTWVPPNVKFMVDDAESPWLHPRNHFDMVDGRHTVQAFKDYLAVLRQAYRHMKSSGWVELHELDYICHCDDGSAGLDYKFGEMMVCITQGCAAMGINLYGALTMADRIKEAGFINVAKRILKIPIGPWPKNKLLRKVGLYYQAVVLDGLQGIALGPLCRGLGWSAERVEVYLKDVRVDVKDPRIHSYMNMHVLYGQKPE